MHMTPSEAMVETLLAEGVQVVSGIVGSAFMDPLDLFPAAGIRFVPVRHEQAAGHVADAYARVTGDVAVCVGQNGPGITNMVTSVAAANQAHSPVVIITPSATTSSVGLDGFQEAEQLSIFRSITKWQAQIPRPDRMAETFRTAFREARARLGPVQVDVPRDYWYGDVHDGIPEPHQYRVSKRGPGDAEAIRKAADLLSSAQRPVIISGYGVVTGNAFREVADLAEFLSAPVANSYLHNDSFDATHQLAVGPIGYMGSRAAMELLSEADVVLALGCRINPFSTVPQYGLDFWPDGAQLIQVDIDPSQLGRTKRIDVGIIGDARATAQSLMRELRRTIDVQDARENRLAHIREVRETWQEELNSLSASEDTPISPRRALRDLADAIPDDAIVTTDIGNICSVANGYFTFDRPRSFLAAMNFGNCGFAYPAALGAKLAQPHRPVVAVVGDGAWAMGLEEVMTAVEEDIPVVAVVFNNGEWGAEKRNQINFYGNRFVGTDIGNEPGAFNFADIAVSMGAQGERIEDPTKLKEAFNTAINSDSPTVLEIVVDPEELAEPFRRDALRAPRRLMQKYRHLSSD